jgi:hypothetical protein
MVSQSVSTSWCRVHCGTCDQILILFDSLCLVFVGRLFWGAAAGPSYISPRRAKQKTMLPIFDVYTLPLLAIQSWLAKWRMKTNESKSTHITFTMRRGTCLSVHINDVQLTQTEEVKYLGLNLDRRLTWHKHNFTKRKQLGITLTKKYCLLGYKSKLFTNNKLLIYKTILKLIYVQHRNTRMVPVEGSAHDNG